MKIIIFNLTVLILFGCNRQINDSNVIAKEEYTIFKIVIDSLCSVPKDIRKQLQVGEYHIIVKTTAPYDLIMEDHPLLPEDARRNPLYKYPDRDTFATQEAWVEGLNKFYDNTGAKPYNIFHYYKKILPQHNWDFIRNKYLQINRVPLELDSSQFIFDVPHYFIPINRMNEFDSLGNVVGINRPFRRSTRFTILSRVAFSENMDRAVLYYSNGASGGGTFGFVLLIKEKEEWLIYSRLLSMWL